MTDDTEWADGTWEGNRRSMVRRNLQLTVRERLEQLDELRELSDRLAKARVVQGGGPGDELLLGGCRTTPLASYLKALGVLRLVAEQADREARGRWSDEGFHLSTSLARNRVLDFFLREYRPTPILSPWNGGSGFFPKDNQTGIKPIEESAADRFAPLRATIGEIRRALTELELTDGMRAERKGELLTRLRAELNDAALAWFDAAVLLTEETPRYPPLLGTGGNDGRLDFTNNFLQRLAQLFDSESGEPREGTESLLRGALFGDAIPGLWTSAMGQYAPADIGGPNATTGFEGSTLMNPWDFLLMLEGALLFAASASRRLESAGEGRLAYPFTVRPTGAGSGSTASVDERTSRGEIWMPLWERNVSYEELRTLLGEGRAVVSGHGARDGLDFVRAVANLGVDRGISEFVRYGFLMRNGKAYLASPLTRVRVRANPAGTLVDQLDHGNWLSRFKEVSRAGENAPARLVSLGHRLQEGLFQMARGARVGSAARVQEVLVTLGEIHRYFASAPQAREKVPPIPLLDERWVRAGNDGSPEFLLAAALAGLHAERRSHHGADRERPEVGMRLAAHLAPVADGYRNGGWEAESREVVWRDGNLELALLAVLERRLIRAGMQGGWEKPLAGFAGAPLSVIGEWLARGGDADARIARLIPGLALAKIPDRLPRKGAGRDFARPLPACYFVLKPLFCTERQLYRTGALEKERTLPLPLSLARRLARLQDGGFGRSVGERESVVSLAVRQLRLAGVTLPFGHGKEADAEARSLSPTLARIDSAGIDGRRLLAALLVPISDVDLKRVLRRISTHSRVGSAARTEIASAPLSSQTFASDQE